MPEIPTSPGSSSGTSLTIVGSGIAGLSLALRVRERHPRIPIRILTTEPAERLGGHLSCHRDGPYVTEHGYHTLFEFYEETRTLLRELGASHSFRLSEREIFVHGRGALHPFDPRLIFGFQGFPRRDRVALARWIPTFLRHALEIERGGLEALEAYDHLDLREHLRRTGMPRAIVESDLMRMFYAFAFHGEEAMSATMGLQVLMTLMRRPRLMHFLRPADEALIHPLVRRLEELELRIEPGVRLRGLRSDPAGSRVESLELVDTKSGEARWESVDLVALALGVESLKALDLGGAERLPFFRRVGALRGVESFSVQAWFREDPVPPGIDNVVAGIPGPLSVLLPVSRIRGGPDPAAGGYELIAIAPSEGMKESPEEATHRLFRELRRLGFRVPEGGPDLHLHAHRNRSAEGRYLMPSPGQLRLRPGAQSPFSNLVLAGAWLRNPLSIPCVEAALQSSRRAADLLSQKVRARERAPSLGMPRRHPLCLLTPYRKRDVVGAFFLLPCRPEVAAEELPDCVVPLAGFKDRLVWSLMRYGEVWSESDPSGARYSFQELVVSLIAHERGHPERVGLFPLAIYIDSDVAVACGREMYGFPKKLAELSIGEDRAAVRRPGLRPGEPPGPVHPITLLEAGWEVEGAATEATERAIPLEAGLRAALTAGGQALFRALPGMPFYLHQVIPEPGWRPGRVALSRVLRAPALDVEIHDTARLREGRFRVGASTVDPLYRLLPGGTSELRAERGLRVRMSFGMGPAEVLEEENLDTLCP